MSLKILLDTDIGGDIDDAFCLVYLLAQHHRGNCELLGITTVSGRAVERAMLASVLCKVADLDIPIYPGVEFPLSGIGGKIQPEAPQASILSKFKHETTFPQGQAVDFLQKTIRAHPNEITLLTIGALTNIALLFQQDPEMPSLLKNLVMMGGVFTHRYSHISREWNVEQDPRATSLIYASPIGTGDARNHRSVGLDVTLQVILPLEQVIDQCVATGNLTLVPVLAMAQVNYGAPQQVITFHDPLAAATLFDEEICRYNAGHIAVFLDQGHSLKQTSFFGITPGSSPDHEVAVWVNSPHFFTHYFEVLRWTSAQQTDRLREMWLNMTKGNANDNSFP